jgi:putative transposase
VQNSGDRKLDHKAQKSECGMADYQVRKWSAWQHHMTLVMMAMLFMLNSNHKLPVAPNLLDRKFAVDRPNSAWCCDITYLWTMQGWLYLAVIIDLYSRKVVGWARSPRMKTALVIDALSMATIGIVNRRRD